MEVLPQVDLDRFHTSIHHEILLLLIFLKLQQKSEKLEKTNKKNNKEARFSSDSDDTCVKYVYCLCDIFIRG